MNVELPSVLAQLLQGQSRIEVRAQTLAGALRALTNAHAALAVHLFDESGDLRQHVLCFHNGTNTRWLENRDVPVQDGDTITIMQAVSGG